MGTGKKKRGGIGRVNGGEVMKEDHARAKNGAIPFYPGCPRRHGASARLTEIYRGYAVGAASSMETVIYVAMVMPIL